MIPAATPLRATDTHRLIPARYADGPALARIADSDDHLRDLFDLDNLTNDRLRGEADSLPGIGARELVSGVPHAGIINAAFTHPNPLGGRFNGPDRGAWYAGLELKTSQAEIAFHRSLEYAEVAWDEPDQSEYQDFLANFDAEFHDLRGDVRFAPCLARESYAASQRLAASLLARGSAGLVYASVRAPGGTCVACFRPALVNNVRLGRCWRFQWLGLGEAPRFEEA